MATYTFTPSSGPAITFGQAPPYILQARPEGLSGIPQEDRLLRSPQQHGATHTDNRKKERYISIPLTIWAATETSMWNNVSGLIEAFNPELKLGAFRITLPDGKVREILAKGEDNTPWIGPAINYATHAARIDLLCPHPNFYDPTEVSTTFTLGQNPQQDTKTLTNLGHVTAPMEITINGPVDAPRLFLSPKNLILNHTLVTGEQLVITTGPGAPSVIQLLPGEDPLSAMRFVSLQSEFFGLEPGDNVVAYLSADSETPNRGTMVVKFKHYYNGV